MTWVKVDNDDPKRSQLKAARDMFKNTAPSQNRHLNIGQLRKKVKKTFLDDDDQKPHLFRLYLYDLSQTDSADYHIAVLFDCSIHRTRRPGGDIQKWDWSIHIGVEENTGMTNVEIYEAVLDLCRTFLGNNENDSPVPGVDKKLVVIGDLENDFESDPFYVLLQADIGSGRIETAGVSEVIEVSNENYHYYRQPRHGQGRGKPEGGLGEDGELGRIHIIRINA